METTIKQIDQREWFVLVLLILFCALINLRYLQETQGHMVFQAAQWTLIVFAGGISFYLREKVSWFPDQIGYVWLATMIAAPLLMWMLDTDFTRFIQLVASLFVMAM